MSETKDELQRRIEVLGRRLLEDIESWEVRSRGVRAKALERVTERVEKGLSRALDRQARREAKRERRAARRAEKKRDEIEHASKLGGLVMLAVAVMCAGYAFVHPTMWWLIFVALGIGSGGARQFALASRRDRERLPAPTESAATAAPALPTNEIDPLCDQLLADLQQSPDAVRQFVQNPEQTIQALRTTCHALSKRRAQLGEERPTQRLADLERQRGELTLKRDAASDETARRRLTEALGSLDSQVLAVRQLGAAYERVDGEYTSLLVTLQELRTRVSLAKSAGGAVQLEGLKQSVGRLNLELEAITDALAMANAPIAPVGGEAHEAGEAARVRE